LIDCPVEIGPDVSQGGQDFLGLNLELHVSALKVFPGPAKVLNGIQDAAFSGV